MTLLVSQINIKYWYDENICGIKLSWPNLRSYLRSRLVRLRIFGET